MIARPFAAPHPSRREFLWRSAAFAAVASSPLARSAQAKPSPTFEIVSIRPSGTLDGGHIGPGPNRYEAVGVPLRGILLQAYLPAWQMRDALKGVPGWLENDKYDFIGQVSDADLPEYQRQRSAQGTKPMLQAMLQAALADRCKLVLHREPREIQSFDLLVSKRGAKVKLSTADEEIPQRSIKIPGGGIMVPIPRGSEKPAVTFFQTSMASLSEHLGSRYLVVDKTGLTGTYDFSLPQLDQTGLTGADQNPMTLWDVSALGLEWRSSKAPADYLVIDHIERPSPN